MRVASPRASRYHRFAAAAVATAAMLALIISVVLAAGMTANPSTGPRDNGSGVQTSITVTGDVSPSGGTTTWGAPHAYWDTPDPNNPATAYQIAVPSSAAVANDGTFSFVVQVPLKDGAGNVVRPGSHTIIVCLDHHKRNYRLPLVRQHELPSPQGDCVVQQLVGPSREQHHRVRPTVVTRSSPGDRALHVGAGRREYRSGQLLPRLVDLESCLHGPGRATGDLPGPDL